MIFHEDPPPSGEESASDGDNGWLVVGGSVVAVTLSVWSSANTLSGLNKMLVPDTPYPAYEETTMAEVPNL